MQNNHFISIIVPALLTFAVMVGLTQVLGGPLQEAFIGMTAYILYALFFIVVYFLRFGLLLLSLYAAYRITQKRFSKQVNQPERFQEFPSVSD